MKSVMTEAEVSAVTAAVVDKTLHQLPYNSQDALDADMAEHFVLKRIAKIVNPRLDKLEDRLKKQYRDSDISAVTLSNNYRREVGEGTPRASFDKEKFIDLISNTYPEIMKHQLRELAEQCNKLSAAPISISVDYIGDVPRSET
jgi:hypothetical protein